MKLSLRFRRLPDTDKNRAIVHEEINRLAAGNDLAAVEALVEQPEQDVSIRVQVKVDADGTPLRAEARDYTLRAVMRKALGLLRKKLNRRRLRRQSAETPKRRHSPAAAARA
ncbi:MAG: hypothetical protein KA004_11185 [Verrucomicrobiales bacterium]|nr:hypothetical protein [Verrucomicrobiales bacterium]